MTDTKTPSPSDAELDALALEISDYDDPVYFRRMARAVLVRWGQPQAVEQAIEALRLISQNSTDDPRGQADKAIALLLAAPPPQAVREPTIGQVTAAAKKLAECMDYPWEHMTAQGRSEMHKHAKAVLEAAHGITKGGQHGDSNA